MSDARYRHAYHAGNVGDVLKHCVLLALLAARAPGAARLTLIETHAGAGRYPLGPTGEWTEGVGKVWAAPPRGAAAVERYLDGLSSPSEHVYPGSPLFERAWLRPEDRATLCELDDEAATALTRHLDDRRFAVRRGDGFAALPGLVAEAPAGDALLVIIDPPYTEKAEWQAVVRAVAAVYVARPAAQVLLWYPLKSYTRPNALHLELKRAAVPATVLELVTTPLELRRNRLNGSGVLLVNPPAAAVVEIAQALPLLGARCATHAGEWASRMLSWGAGMASLSGQR